MPLITLFKSDGSDKFSKALGNAGFDVQSINCLEFRFKNLETLREKLGTPEQYEGIIFTSQRAVEGTTQAINKEPKNIARWIGKSNFCVGESTSELCKSLLDFEPEGKDTGNAKNLATLIIEKYANESGPKPFLFPSGNLTQDSLEKCLSDHQIGVEVVELYDTVVHPSLDSFLGKLKPSEIDFIVFFSPSGVKFLRSYLVENKNTMKHTKTVAIGPATRKALEDLTLNCDIMCTKPTPEALIEALKTSREQN